jgi:hypothetical protein
MKVKVAKDEPGIKQVTVRLREDDWKRLAHLAIDTDTSIHALIIRGLNEVLKAHKLPLIRVE